MEKDTNHFFVTENKKANALRKNVMILMRRRASAKIAYRVFNYEVLEICFKFLSFL